MARSKVAASSEQEARTRVIPTRTEYAMHHTVALPHTKTGLGFRVLGCERHTGIVFHAAATWAVALKPMEA